MGERAACAVLLLCSLGTSGCRRAKPDLPEPASTPAKAMSGEPAVMLWAWETPEDLRALDVRQAGVAFLAREVFIDEAGGVRVRPRRQPLLVAEGIWLMATVRVEAAPGLVRSAQTAQAAARAIAAAAGEKNVRAVQVDFDVTASQRDFYRDVLQALRAELPQGMPLSMTALVSWCGPHSWLRGLPVDEAVPMFFRMGGPAATRAQSARSADGLAEPLCAGSVGMATDEARPAMHNGARVYVFHPGSWPADVLAQAGTRAYWEQKGAR